MALPRDGGTLGLAEPKIQSASGSTPGEGDELIRQITAFLRI
jgi:hypothetical protein